MTTFRALKFAFLAIFCTLSVISTSFGQQRQSNVTGMKVLGQAVAQEFSRWQIGSPGVVTSGAGKTITLAQSTAAVPDGTFISPITTTNQIKIVDGPNTETVTPTSVNCSSGGAVCTFVATLVNSHLNNFYVTSGSAGLQEAIDLMHGNGGMVLVTPDWTGTTSMITSASRFGYTNVSILDTRAGSEVYYTWDTVGLVYQQVFSITSTTTPNFTQYLTAYGALCNGITDDSAAITAAGVALASTGGVIELPPGKTCVINGNVSIGSNITLLSRGNGILSISTGKTLTVNGPITAPPQTLFTLNGTGVVSLGTNTKIDFVRPEWWGGKADNSTDNGVPFTAMTEAFDHVSSNSPALTCGHFVASQGIYLFTTTWLVEKHFGCHFEGTSTGIGTTSNSGSTTLKWGGNNTDPLLRIFGSRDSIFENFQILSSSTLPLAVGIQLETRSSTTITRNVFNNVSFQGTNSGGLVDAIKITTGTGGDQNNEWHQFNNVDVNNYTHAAVYQTHRQAKNIKFNHFVMAGNFAFSQYGMKFAYGEIDCEHCNGGQNNIADFSVDDVGQVYIANGRFENSASFFRTGGSNNDFPVTLINNTWASGSSFVAADHRWIDYGFRGPLTLIGNVMNNVSDLPMVLRAPVLNQGAGTPTGSCRSAAFVAIGNTFNTSLATIFTSDSAPSYASGNVLLSGTPPVSGPVLNDNFGGTSAAYMATRWCDGTNQSNGLVVDVGDNAISIASSMLFKVRYAGQVNAISDSSIRFGVDKTGNVIGPASGAATLGTNALPYGSVYIGNAATNNFRLTGTAAAARTVTLPDASFTVSGLAMYECGSGTNTCGKTLRSSVGIIQFGGSAALDGASPSKAVITSLQAFTSTSTYNCTVSFNQATLATGTLSVDHTSTTSITITGPNGANGPVDYICIGR